MNLTRVSKGSSLDRYYLFKFFGYGIFLHKIHNSDPPEVYHDHPWDGISVIFGSYTEYLKPFFEDGLYKYNRKFINFIDARNHHRVEVNKPIWTLFLHGRKYNTWTIKSEDKIIQEPWSGENGYKNYNQEIKNK